MQAKSWKRMLAIFLALVLMLGFAAPLIQMDATYNSVVLAADSNDITVSVTDVSSKSRSDRTLAVNLYDNDGTLVTTVSSMSVQRYSETSGQFPNWTTYYYYLIPVDDLETIYGSYGYTFNDDEVNNCSIFYSSTTGTQGEYVSVTENGNTTYYVQIETTSNNISSMDLYYARANVVEDTVSPSGTVIHLFDYWLSDSDNDRYASDASFTYPTRDNPNAADQRILGINNNGTTSGHALKFSTAGSGLGLSDFNTWTGTAEIFEGIVANTLGSDGYPQLSSSVTNSTESLSYLFDPAETHVGKASYSNVTGLLQVNSDGYYYYDCTENYAEFDESTNSFILYDDWAIADSGQFFPFDAYSTVNKTTGTTNLNHYFGMALTTRFIQQYGGYTTSEQQKQTTFEFSGDDDVWIFVDGVLIGDVGGIHNAASISINFATGAVVINEGKTLAITNGRGQVTGYRSIEINTTLYQLFVDAGLENTVDWTTTAEGYTIFADNTYHSLQFYYLERGNGSSNLSLKYNLVEIPESSIYKVDQYGDPVAGATFAIYEARIGDLQTDGEYTYYYVLDDGVSYYDSSTMKQITETSGTITLEEATSVSEKLANGIYTYETDSGGDRTGNILYNGSVIYTAKYIGTTDSAGELKFRNNNDVMYTLEEMQELFGQYFIMREIVIPEGYRMVSEEIYMEIRKINGNYLMVCNNTYTSGVYASPIEMVTATDRLYYTYTGTDGSTKTGTVLYNDVTNSQQDGTLIAVVLKYTGDELTSANWETEMAKTSSWTPVYGEDDVGYTLVDTSQYSSFTEAVIAAAKEQSAYSQVVFKTSGGTGAMQISLTCLPGDITTYYHMLSSGEEQNTQYTIAYYWIDADSLDDATVSNTYRVLSDAFTDRTITDQDNQTSTSLVSSYTGFYRTFGTTVSVPDLINRFFVQKLDEDGNLINGAYFAMYEVSEDTDGTIYYVADPTYTDSRGTQTSSSDILIYLEGDEDNDGEIDNTGRAYLKGGSYNDGYTYTVDETNGVITVTNGTYTYTVTPKQVKETVSANDADNPSYEEGTACFTYMTEGTYYIREICAPAGYVINTTEIMVLVTDDAIYGSAGTDNDGVTVARGAGYLVSSLERFASEGEIDRTLSWIYEYLIINTDDIETFDIGDPYDYDTDADWTKQSDISYLEYSPSYDQLDFVFDYVKNEARYDPAHAVDTRRLFADEGWVALEIMQDYTYGSTQAASASFNYDEITHSITHLFSRSLYIRVTDEAERYDLKFMKIDGENADTVDDNDDRVLDTNIYTAINGAVFTIYQQIPETDAYGNVVLDNGGNVQYIWSLYDTATSGKNPDDTDGVSGLVIFEDLSAGYYMISETTAADGYSKASWDWYVTVTVDADGDPVYTIASSVDTTAAGYFAYYTYSETDVSTAVDLASLEWYTDASESGGNTTVQYYYWPNYLTLYDYEFYKIDGDTVTVSQTDESVLTTVDALTYLEDVDFTIYIQQLVTDGNGNALNASGAITTDPDEYQYEWVEYEYTTTQVPVVDANGDPVLDGQGNQTYTTVNTAVGTSDSSGKVSFTGLPSGTYKIEETGRADGYLKATWYWEVTIDDSGGITVSNVSSTGSTTDQSMYTYTVTAGDGTGYDAGTVLYFWPNYIIDYELPSTGRFDIYCLTFGGILIMCFSAGFYIHGTYEERRRRRRPVSREKGS